MSDDHSDCMATGMCDDFTVFVESTARQVGLTLVCRKMHRDAYEYDGEWFPAYDEYEVRWSRGRRIWTFDAALATFDRDDVAYILRHEFREPVT